jgi:DNA-binding Lrp family transcriptional regulator
MSDQIAASPPQRPRKDSPKTADTAVDALDLKILVTLQAHARLTNQQLSGMIGLSPSATLQRVRRLEARRLILGYHAKLDLERLRPVLFVYAEVTLASQFPADFERFETIIATLPEIIAADQISGQSDYLLQAVVRDVNAWRELADYLLSAEVGAAKITSSIRMKTAKSFQGYALATPR